MSEQKASITMSKPGESLPKPVKDMTPEEKETTRKAVLEKLESQIAAGNKATIDIVIDSGEYQGTITMRRPSLDEERQIGIRVAKYLQGAVGVDVKTENLAIFFATFDVLVDWDNAPEWFKPREISDYALVNYIYGRFAEWLRSFRGFVPPEHQGDSEATAGASQVVDSK